MLKQVTIMTLVAIIFSCEKEPGPPPGKEMVRLIRDWYEPKMVLPDGSLQERNKNYLYPWDVETIQIRNVVSQPGLKHSFMVSAISEGVHTRVQLCMPTVTTRFRDSIVFEISKQKSGWWKAKRKFQSTYCLDI